MGGASRKQGLKRHYAVFICAMAVSIIIWLLVSRPKSNHLKSSGYSDIPRVSLSLSPDDCSLYDSSMLQTYLEVSKDIQGWMEPLQLAALRVISAVQRKHCIAGTVGEIGVHYGLYFYAMLSIFGTKEKSVAIDLFSLQEMNVDASGWDGTSEGRTEKFLSYGTRMGLKEEDIMVISGDSTLLTSDAFKEKNIPAFKFFSVDGGHSFKVTLSDMGLAAASIRDGGVIVADDFGNSDWPGVLEAVITFLRQHNNHIAPFLWSCNKMYFTTVNWHGTYLDAMRKSSCFNCSMDKKNIPGGQHISTYSLADWPLCIHQGECKQAMTAEEVEKCN